MARLLDSVAPLVKMISFGSAPIKSASCAQHGTASVCHPAQNPGTSNHCANRSVPKPCLLLSWAGCTWKREGTLTIGAPAHDMGAGHTSVGGYTATVGFWAALHQRHEALASLRATSTASSVSHPKKCVRECGLPYWSVINGSIASSTRGSSGVVACEVHARIVASRCRIPLVGDRATR